MNRSTNNTRECKAIGALLVDFADGETTVADSGRVEQHVAECSACRTKLAALRRSLCVLESIWAVPDVVVAPDVPSRRSPRWRLAAALGGVAAVVAISFGVYRAQRPADLPASAVAHPNEGTTAGAQTAASDADFDVDDLDIDAFIQRREQSARLAASVQILTSLPVDRDDTQRAQRYLRNAYGVGRSGEASEKPGEL